MQYLIKNRLSKSTNKNILTTQIMQTQTDNNLNTDAETPYKKETATNTSTPITSARTKTPTVTVTPTNQLNEIESTIVTKFPYLGKQEARKVSGKIYVTKDTRVTRNNTQISFNQNTFKLVIKGNDEMSDSVFKPYTVLPNYKKVGSIKFLSPETTNYILVDLYRVTYQTDGNIFYTTNFEQNRDCIVGNYSATPPCVWLPVSFSTKTFLWISLDCGSEIPSQKCLNWADSIITTLELMY